MAEIEAAYKKAFPQLDNPGPGGKADVPVRVKAGARQQRLRIERDEQGQACIRADVTAPPKKGKAKAAVCKLLAKELGVAKSCIEIVKGRSAPYKVVRITC